MNKIKKILSIDGFRYKTKERLDEIKNTLMWNSKFFNTIHIWCQENADYDAFKEFESEKIVVHKLNREKMISMKELYDFTNEVSNDEDYKFFANSDTTFGEEIINYNCDDDWFILFTNRSMRDPNIGQAPNGYQLSENDGLMIFNRDLIIDKTWFQDDDSIRNYAISAHCGWSWKSKKIIEESNCYLGTQGGENCFLTKIFESGFNPKAGVIKYPTYHNHRTNEKTERFNIGVRGANLNYSDYL
jgi:hypothetical protein